MAVPCRPDRSPATIFASNRRALPICPVSHQIRTRGDSNDWAEVEYLHLKDGRTVAGTFVRSLPNRFRALDGTQESIAPPAIANRWKKYYVSFPPFPSAIFMPFVAIWGLNVNDVLLSVVLAAMAPALLFLVLRRLSARGDSTRSEEDDLWLTLMFGLGTLNQNLPGFVVLCPGKPVVGPQLWSSSFLPGIYQGTHIRNNSLDPDRIIRDVTNRHLSRLEQRGMLDLVQELNREHLQSRGDDLALEARIASMEMAFRMQFEAREAFDLANESRFTREQYGNGEFAAGYMPLEQAEVIIRHCVRLWRDAQERNGAPSATWRRYCSQPQR